MTFDTSIGYGLLLSVAFWAAVIGAATALGVWAFLMFSETAGELGRNVLKGGKSASESAVPISEPAEEGAQLDEWEPDRLDKAA